MNSGMEYLTPSDPQGGKGYSDRGYLLRREKKTRRKDGHLAPQIGWTEAYRSHIAPDAPDAPSAPTRLRGSDLWEAVICWRLLQACRKAVG